MSSQRKVVLFIAVSLDWLDAVEGEGDNGFLEFYETIDTMIMGKATYDYLMTLVEEFPHADKTCYVCSRSETRQSQYVEFVNEDVAQLIRKLKEQDGSNIWLVGGGGLVASFLKEKLIDECIVTISPTILGKGIPLFKNDNPECKLELKECKRYGQFVQLYYGVR